MSSEPDPVDGIKMACYSLPAIENTKTGYFKDGRFHREGDMPAIVDPSSGCQEWNFNGGGVQEWWIHGVQTRVVRPARF